MFSTNRQYHSSPTQLGGRPNQFRVVGRLDALARLLIPIEKTPVCAVTLHKGKLIIGFNSPRTDQANFTEYCSTLHDLVAKRIQLLKSYYKEQDKSIIWPLALALSMKSPQSAEHPFEYPVDENGVFSDLSKGYDALYAAQTDEFLDDEEYFIALLQTQGESLQQARNTYINLKNDQAFREAHPLFNKNSLSRLFISKELQEAFEEENFQVVVEPQIVNGTAYDTVHAEVAVANFVLSELDYFNQNERPLIVIGVSKLNCSNCSNYFHMLNHVFNDYDSNIEYDNTIKLPMFFVSGTHSCHFANWRAILPTWVVTLPGLLETFKKNNLEMLTSSASQHPTSIQLTPSKVKINGGLVKNPITNNEIIKNLPLAMVPGEAQSPAKSKSRATKNSPARNKHLSNERSVLRVTIKTLSDQRIRLIQKREKLTAIKQSLLNFTKEITSPANDNSTIKKNKTLSKYEITTLIKSGLKYIDEPDMKTTIEQAIKTIDTFEDTLAVPANVVNKFLGIRGNLTESDMDYQNLYHSPAKYIEVEHELAMAKESQNNIEEELAKLHTTPNTGKRPQSPYSSVNNNNNNNNNNNADIEKDEKLLQPVFKRMHITPDINQAADQSNNCQSDPAFGSTLPSWSTMPVASFNSLQDNTPQKPRKMPQSLLSSNSGTSNSTTNQLEKKQFQSLLLTNRN